MPKSMKRTIKTFERLLCNKHTEGTIKKTEHFENGWDEDNNCPKVTKLWLYHLNSKHVGTYDRNSRTCWFI